MKKSVAVLGLGKYGRSLAENLYRLGADVLAVDSDEEIINDISDKCTSAVVANLSVEDEVEALGLKNMDVVVICTGGDLAASIMCVAVAKDQGVPLVVCKTSSPRMSTILTKVGADKIINPEGEGGGRSARILISESFKDFFEIDENMYMIETRPKKEWLGKTLMQLNLRQKMNLNVVAIKIKNSKWQFVDPNMKLPEDCFLLIVMEKKYIKNWK